MSNTIIYLTDHSLDEKLNKLCQKILLREAREIPIISVSQRPIEFGKNICVGEIGRSWLSLYKQLKAGIDNVETENIVICEHDCIYTYEHLSFSPPKDNTVYYNNNTWLVQYDSKDKFEYNGMFSFMPRRYAMSQLVANKEFMRIDTDLRLRVLMDQTDDISVIRAQQWAATGRSMSIGFLIQHKLPDHPHQRFTTKIPSLDIRHNDNFTGSKRGKKRCWELPYWGKLEDIMEI